MQTAACLPGEDFHPSVRVGFPPILPGMTRAPAQDVRHYPHQPQLVYH